MKSITDKKAQVGLVDAPQIVLIVGLTFLIMATVALVSEKYQDSFSAGEDATVVNETFTAMTEVAQKVANEGQCNFESLSVSKCTNASSGVTIAAANYTVGTDTITYSGDAAGYNNTDWKCDYTYSYTGLTCNVTTDLNTEISNNTSIAGIVLTISLVGIVLAVLVGVFIGVRRGI